MKPTQAKLLSAICIAALGVSGCGIATNEKISRPISEKYSNISEFLTHRLSDYHYFSGWKSQVRGDGVIVFSGYFNGANTASIRKPREDAEGYCTQRGGNWVQLVKTSLETYRGEQPPGDPIATYNYAKSRGASEEVARAATASTISRMQAFYRHSPVAQDRRLIDRMAMDGYFGLYMCSVDKEKWTVSLIPTNYTPGKKGVAPSLDIEVSAWPSN